MKFSQLGRSMVEMLGVLAIIGVLSVGAISGYSKAMMKYKLNKQAEQISTLIYNAFELYNRPEFNAQNVSSSFTYLVPVMYKLGLIPANELYRNQGFEDAMGNLILLSWILPAKTPIVSNIFSCVSINFCCASMVFSLVSCIDCIVVVICSIAFNF